MKIEEIDKDGNVAKRTDLDLEGSDIGNSFIQLEDKSFLFFSAIAPSWILTVTELSSELEVGQELLLPVENREQNFPTDVFYYNGYYFIGYNTREKGGPVALEENAYYPALKILDSDLNIVYDTQISEEEGSAHVHPYLAVTGDRLFFSWSKKVGAGPQVMIEEFKIG